MRGAGRQALVHSARRRLARQLGARGDRRESIAAAERVLDEDARDARDAAALYAILENEIVPDFYDRDQAGLPRRWRVRIQAEACQSTRTK